eukprot:c1204_g1_i1 orf=74-454(+)
MEGLNQALGRLGRHGVQASVATFVSLLRSCCRLKALSVGRRVHAHIIRTGCIRDRFLGNLLIQMYGICGSLEEARAVFEKLREPNVYSWNIMFMAYAQNGSLVDARNVFDKMPRRNVVSWTAMITA